jgi:hypothetical protein
VGKARPAAPADNDVEAAPDDVGVAPAPARVVDGAGASVKTVLLTDVAPGNATPVDEALPEAGLGFRTLGKVSLIQF